MNKKSILFCLFILIYLHYLIENCNNNNKLNKKYTDILSGGIDMASRLPADFAESFVATLVSYIDKLVLRRVAEVYSQLSDNQVTKYCRLPNTDTGDDSVAISAELYEKLKELADADTNREVALRQLIERIRQDNGK